ncbi:hypothetical protein MRX96_011082 [Rhipicephalus microplus]
MVFEALLLLLDAQVLLGPSRPARCDGVWMGVVGRPAARLMRGQQQAASGPRNAVAPAASLSPKVGSNGKSEATTLMRSVDANSVDEDKAKPPEDVLLLKAVECAQLQAPDIVKMIKKDSVLAKLKD